MPSMQPAYPVLSPCSEHLDGSHVPGPHTTPSTYRDFTENVESLSHPLLLTSSCGNSQAIPEAITFHVLAMSLPYPKMWFLPPDSPGAERSQIKSTSPPHTHQQYLPHCLLPSQGCCCIQSQPSANWVRLLAWALAPYLQPQTPHCVIWALWAPLSSLGS